MASFVMDASYSTWAKDVLSIQGDPRIEIHKFTDGEDERGIYANSHIPANTTLAIVPFASLLTIEHLNEVSSLLKLKDVLREDDLLALLLTHEQSLGSQSKWSTHISLLPKVYHSIINHTDDELEKIQGSNLYVIAKRWKQQVRDDFTALQHTLEQHQLLTEGSFFTLLNYEKYLWCLSTIWSRFISIEKGSSVFRAMVPLVDLLNHHPKAQVGHAYNAADDKFYLFTGQPFESGAEIFLNYGHIPNARLMMLYGFALLDNPHSFVDLWATMDVKNATGSKKLAVLQELGIEAQSSFKLETDKIPQELLHFLRLQQLDSNELSSKTSSQLCDLIKKPLSPTFERKVWESLRAAVYGMLNAYAFSIEEDRTRLISLGLLQEGKDSTTFCHPMYHEKHALILVYTEKIVLHSVMNQVKKKLELLDRIVQAVNVHKAK